MIRLWPEPEDWMKDARCAGPNVDPDWWTGEVFSTARKWHTTATLLIRRVKHHCATCSVRRECLLTALRFEQVESSQEIGVWGGTTAAERKDYKPDQVDELLDVMTEQAKKHGLMKKEKAA